LLEGLVVIVTALVASVLAAFAGFGGSVIMLPVLVWTVGVVDAVPILTIAQLIGNLSRVLFNRHDLKWPVVWRFALGAIPTAIIGGIIFAKTPAAALLRVLGVFLILMVVYRHTYWGKNVKLTLRGFIPLGAASGILSAIMGTVGPLAAPFFLAYGLVKGAYISTEAMTAVVMHITKLGVYGSYSLIGAHTLLIGLGIGAIMIPGTYLGRRLLYRVPERVFPYVIEATLLISGIVFLVRGS
jgi:uncharacterized membrane protein YfcA